MKIKVAKSAGFCFGVKRAVELAEELALKGEKVYTYGEIIHNESVIKNLEDKGAVVIKDLDDLKSLEKGVLIIRSHGIPETDYQKILKSGIAFKDATCPFVKKIHKLIRKYSEDSNNQIIIIGSKNHPEVIGTKSYSLTKPIIFEEIKDVITYTENKENFKKTHVFLVQTTFDLNKFQDIVEIFNKKGYHSIVLNTICNATSERQVETDRLSKEVDAMIVVGGRHSSNTQKLYDICIKNCVDTYYIQTLADLDCEKLRFLRCVGITAGASTPNNIIEEVRTGMAEKSFEEMLEESLTTIHNGEVVEGTVIDVKEDEIILNIGYKADGVLTKSEYSNTPTDLTTVVKVGDKMEVKVLKVNDGEGQVLLTYKRLAAERGNKRLEEAFNNKETLKAKVNKVLKGGLSVVIEEARVFIPASLVSDVYEQDLEKYADKEIEFRITDFNPRKRRIIGNRKELILEEKAEMKKALFDRIEVGQVIDGTVKNITDFGVFIDLGGADGLLHVSEMSWGHIENPKKVFKVGDMVKTFIKDIQGDKIALSLKFKDQNPWNDADKKFAIGTIVTGKVARMTDFGAFIELEPGIDALLHVSQIATNHVDKPSDVLKIGEEITAKVVDFVAETKKISLSIKALLAKEDDSEDSLDSPILDETEGKVENEAETENKVEDGADVE